MASPDDNDTKPGSSGSAPPKSPRKHSEPSQKDYHHPAAAWGAAFSVGRILVEQGAVLDGVRAIFQMNHENGGFDCPGCAWPDDRKGLRMDICENGIKHVTWEMTKKRADRHFFAKHTMSELESWSDFDLENTGRLTEPMVYNSSTDRYEPISWDGAFKMIGEQLRSLASPNKASFYTSGRLSNEATFLYQLFAREYGTNNLPDCSNMCHEASGRALTAALGTGKGTVDLIDWQKSDAIFVIGVNAATNTPRMLSALVDGVKEHGTKIVHINPLIEVAATSAITPHEILDMITFKTTVTSSLNLQPRIGGDMAIMRGIGKYLFEKFSSDKSSIDTDFVEKYTDGFEAYKSICESTSWDDIELYSGLKADQIRTAAEIYRQAKSSIISWCLGVSQQEFGVDTIREFVNVLLLRGNLGRQGAGPCPIRGHSNVQGNRTCGIHHAPPEEWLAKMDAACGIKSPRTHGLDTVRTIEGMYNGDVEVFFGMGGNFAAATPDRDRTYSALRRCKLTVHVSTKLNRSHVIHGKQALILPCLGRTEKDRQASGEQQVTVEDSMSMVHLSVGMNEPASAHLRSELAIIAGIAKATLDSSPTPWDTYIGNYDLIRDKMAESISGFENFNERVRKPLGFRLTQAARDLSFLTPNKRANFSAVPLHNTLPPAGKLMLCTLRSHDQFNTTVYSDNDRYRGVKGSRELLFMNEEDMNERGLHQFDHVQITSFAKDGSTRSLKSFRAIKYKIPKGCAAGYMPELNVLCPIGDFSAQSDQPMMKQIVVEVTRLAN
ncbi:MAG: FdhF/YdeP family oxidoreductase [Candidatus Obscuribacterales bacterium]|jgi:molybdopterin-dependent oxidoreductase alpha subunit|nr:FdhF/YdeP family oxidoreductase [Candidatus Obscuribacterales bacterium]